VPFREVVHPSRETAYSIVPCEPVQREIDCFAADNVERVTRHEYGATATVLDAGKYLGINALCRFSPGVYERNLSPFSLQTQGLFGPQLWLRRKRPVMTLRAIVMSQILSEIRLPNRASGEKPGASTAALAQAV
jgi:hypothetical protein